MNTLFTGLLLSLAYGFAGSFLLFLYDGQAEAKAFFVAYSHSFRTLMSFGLILGTYLIVYKTQDQIPRTIECAFSKWIIKSNPQYRLYRARFYSLRRTITHSGSFAAVGFAIFHYSHFPLHSHAEDLMIFAGAAQYALGVYVGRKLCYAGMMVHSLRLAKVKRNLFQKRELDEINAFVHVTSTLTIIFVYIHVTSYYNNLFLFDRYLGLGVKPFLLLPAVIATPVLLIFNFYPRAVLRKVYGESIEIEIQHLQDTLQEERLSEYEKRSYVMEVEKMARDEMRLNLQLSLEDLPIGITVLIMVLQSLLSK